MTPGRSTTLQGDSTPKSSWAVQTKVNGEGDSDWVNRKGRVVLMGGVGGGSVYIYIV